MIERAALVRSIDGFLAALVARDPARAMLAPDVRYTENGQDLPIGEGAWATVDALGGYRHDFVDPLSGNVATIVVIAGVLMFLIPGHPIAFGAFRGILREMFSTQRAVSRGLRVGSSFRGLDGRIHFLRIRDRAWWCA